MHLTRRSWLHAGLTLPLLGRSAFSQTFPENRPIRWVVPFPPGGQTDSTARLTAQGLATALPANIVVENRAGGQGTVGSDHVRQSPPDGHTLLFSASIFALGRHILKSTRYDPQADFQPVARVGEAPLLVLAANSVPANTLGELIASAKREPQRYSFALSSLGAAGHLATIEFNRMAGVDISMVPYRGAAAALTDLGSNSVQLFIDAGVAALQQVRAGRMKVLAITTAERSPLAPEVPTAAESGLPGFVFNSWYGVWGPRGLPPAVLDKLADGLQLTVANEEVRRQFTNVGTMPAFDGPAAFTDFVARDIERNVALLKAAKFEPE